MEKPIKYLAIHSQLAKARLNIGFLAVLLILSVSLSMKAHAHLDKNVEAARQVIYQYALGVLNGDAQLAGEALSDQIVYSPTVEGHIARMATDLYFDNINFKYADYLVTEAGITVGPVSFIIDSGATVNILNFDLKKEQDGQWRIISIRTAPDFPAEMHETGLADQTDAYPIIISLQDDAGNPVAARICISDSKGDYWPPRGHQKKILPTLRDDIGGDVLIDGKNYAYVRSETIADLPVGSYTIEAVKGMEYETAKAVFTVGDADQKSVLVTIKHWIDMPGRGWYSGDTHVHFLKVHNALLEAQAEGLNVVNVLVSKWGPLYTDVEQFTGAVSKLSHDDHIVYVNEEARHSWLGHTNMLRLKELVYPITWGAPPEGVYGGFDYPAMAQQADKVHAQGGIVTWAHFPNPGGELVVDIALEKIDAIDLFTWYQQDPFQASYPLPPGALLPGTHMPGAAQWYYKFLNTGARIPLTAGTDKMLNIQVVGSVRTYAHIDGDNLSYDRWIEAVKAGRTFVTTGPLLTFTADDQPIGAILQYKGKKKIKLSAHVDIPVGYPADVLEIVHNGKVVATRKIDAQTRQTTLDKTIMVKTSGWFAARVRGSVLLPYQHWDVLGSPGIPAMAHTSPIYVEVGDDKIWSDDDASFLAAHIRQAIDWAETKAHYRNPLEQKEVIEIYKKALEVYTNRSAK
ncbi:MAG: CehA/McbA family metallohydrolase [Deltaproteobacteria bacterium]|nr:CehA/McbA family metallohydrolase [Deltaproteobacteria bacterium]